MQTPTDNQVGNARAPLNNALLLAPRQSNDGKDWEILGSSILQQKQTN